MTNHRFAALGASALALALSIASSGCFSSAVYYRLAVKPDMGKQEVVPFAGNKNVTVIRTVRKVPVGQGETWAVPETSRYLAGRSGWVGAGEKRCQVLAYDGLLAGGRTAYFILSSNDWSHCLMTARQPVGAELPETSMLWLGVIERKDLPKEALAVMGTVQTVFGYDDTSWRDSYSLSQRDPSRCLVTDLSTNLSKDENISRYSCRYSLSRQKRSAVMPWVRPLYAVPAAVLCLPVDAALWVWTPIEMIIRPGRIETWGATYGDALRWAEGN